MISQIHRIHSNQIDYENKREVKKSSGDFFMRAHALQDVLVVLKIEDVVPNLEMPKQQATI